MQIKSLLAALLLGVSPALLADDVLDMDARVELGRNLLFSVAADSAALIQATSSDDATAAIARLEASRDLGASNAAHQLGFMYLAGRFGVEPDLQQAKRNFELAVAQELQAALTDYGLILYYGHQLPKDVDRGLALLNRAAELGNRTAIAFLIDKDPVKADAWFDSLGMRNDEFVLGIDGDPIARAQDYAVGQANMYVAYREGVIVEKNPTQEEDWLSRIDPAYKSTALDDIASFMSSAGHLRSDQKLANALQEIAIANDDSNPTVVNNYAWLLATARSDDLRNGEKAVRLMETLFSQIEPQGFMVDTLAAAYAETGDFDAAIAQQERANAMFATTSQNLEIGTEHLAAYNEGRAWRE